MPSRRETVAPGGMWLHLILVMVIALPLFFWGIGDIPLRDPDEGLYASIAREMADSGDWLTPRFNGLRYLEKPPLYHWLTALTYLLFGFSEWGTRLWAAVGSVGTVLLPTEQQFKEFKDTIVQLRKSNDELTKLQKALSIKRKSGKQPVKPMPPSGRKLRPKGSS